METLSDEQLKIMNQYDLEQHKADVEYERHNISAGLDPADVVARGFKPARKAGVNAWTAYEIDSESRRQSGVCRVLEGLKNS